MSKLNIRDFAQGKQGLSADSGDTPASRDRGKTFSDPNATREILADRLTNEEIFRLACAMEEVREARPGPLTGTQGHVSFSDAFDGDIDSVSESTCKIELVPKNADTRGDNRKKHARKQTMIDCRSILTPPDVNEQPQQAKRSASQVQSSSQPKWNSGGSGQPGKFVFPSKEFKS